MGWGRGGVKSPIHFHCVLHAKRGEGVQKACKIAYVLSGRPPNLPFSRLVTGREVNRVT